MKVYISSDFEGASGIVHYDQTDLAHPEFVRGRKLLMGEVNAAIEGALAQGASEILVNDAHWTYRNLVLEDLNPAAVLLSGKPKPYMMMAGIDGGYEAAFFIAYHARAGSAFANLDHSSNDLEIVQSVWLNDREVGETGLNAALAGYFGVPVVLVTGDQTTCAEAKDLLGEDLETVVVKEAVGSGAAKNIHPTRAREMIREGARRALVKKRQPFVIKPPITVRVAFAKSSQAERCAMMPDIKRVAPRVVEYTHKDCAVLYNAFRVLMMLADWG